MVIRIAIRGVAFTNGQGIVTCLPFSVNFHSHSHSLKIPFGEGGVNHSSHDFPAKKQEKEQVVRNRMEVQKVLKDFRWFISHLSSVVKSAALKKSCYPQVPSSIPAENTSTQIHMDLSK